MEEQDLNSEDSDSEEEDVYISEEEDGVLDDDDLIPECILKRKISKVN